MGINKNILSAIRYKRFALSCFKSGLLCLFKRSIVFIATSAPAGMRCMISLVSLTLASFLKDVSFILGLSKVEIPTADSTNVEGNAQSLRLVHVSNRNVLQPFATEVRYRCRNRRNRKAQEIAYT